MLLLLTNQTVTVPNSVTLKVRVIGTPPFTYHWAQYYGGTQTAISTGNITWVDADSSSTLTLNNSTGLNNYQYECYISNKCPSTAVSGFAALTVNQATPTVNSITFTNNIENHP